MRRVHRAHGLADRRARIGDAEARAGLRDGRGLVPQGLQQARDAIAAFGRADQHRHDMAVAQFAREIVEHLIARRLDVGNQFLHQRVVVIGQLFQHRVPRFFFTRQIAGGHVDDGRGRMLAVDEGAFEREVDEAGGDAVLPDRYLTQQQRRARGGLQQPQRLVHALRGGVDLVEEDEARDAEFLEFAQDELQRGNLARIGLADDDRRVTHRQDVAHFVGEFDRARAVDESVAVAEIIGGGDIGLHAHGVGARLGAGIADRRAVAHIALARYGAGARHDALEERRLPALEGADQRNQPGPHRSSAAFGRRVAHHKLP